MARGWLLDITSSRAGDAVQLWIREAGGGPVHRVEVPYQPPFYVTGAAEPLEMLGRELAERAEVAGLEASAIRTSLFDLPDVRHPALAVTPARHALRRRLATEVDQRGRCVDFPLFDVDLSVDQQYYIEHGLFPGAPVAWSGQEVLALEPAEAFDYAAVPLRLARLSVEVAGARRGRPPEPADPVARVRVGEAVVEEEDEVDTLLALVAEVDRQDPDVLWTQGGDQFDLPHLYRRALAHGLTERELRLGREPRPFGLGRTGSSYVSYGRVYHQSPTFSLVGRIHLDVDEQFVADVKLAGFLDVIRLARLGLHVICRRSPGTAFSAMEVACLLGSGVRVPWKKNLPERPKSARTLLAADRGGVTLIPPVGLFERVDEFDFVSLYPSIMVLHNLSMETLDCACCPDSPELAPGLGYRSCQVRRGIVRQTLEPILKRRLAFRARKRSTTGTEKARYTDLCQAWKWVLVTSFGYQGYRNAKLGRIECHEAINAYARAVLVELMESARAGGWEVLHGIVDSLWLRPPPGGDPEAFGAEVSARTKLQLGYEGRYRWIVFLPDADYGLGVPQRYYGSFEDGELKVRGIEVRRGDTCEFVRATQKEVLALLAEARDGEGFRARVPAALALGRARAERLAAGECPREELFLSLRVSKPLGEYRLLSPAVAALRQLKERGIVREPGQSVELLLREHASRDWRRKALAAELVRGDESYDADAYTVLLARSFATLFEPFGWTEARILAEWGVRPATRPGGRARDFRSLEKPGQRTLLGAAA